MSFFKRKQVLTRELMQYLAPKYVQGKTLDLGAGTAKYRKIFETHVDEYITCDCFEADHIDYVEDAQNLSFPDESFDTVICTMVFEHVAKPWVVADEIKRILKPGGRCIVTAPFMFPYHQDPEDYFRYSTAGMASLFEGLQIEENRGYRGFIGLLESCYRIRFANPYKKKEHSFIQKKLAIVVSKTLHFLDRYFPWSDVIYCEVVFVGKK